MIFKSSFVTPCSGEGGLPPRTPAISSTSSMNTTACSNSSISVNVVRNASASPSPEPARRDGKTSTKGQSSRDATALANVVLPVPGGPNRTIARGGATPYSSAASGASSGSTMRRSMISLSRSLPARFCQRLRASIRPPSSSSSPTSCGWSGTIRSKYVSSRCSYPQLWNAFSPACPSESSADSRCTPRAIRRFSSSTSIVLPSPRPRQSSASASSMTQPRSPPTRAAAAPTTTSPTVTTTATPSSRSAPRISARPYTGRRSARDSSHTRTTWSRSSSWKSRTRGVDMGRVSHAPARGSGARSHRVAHPAQDLEVRVDARGVVPRPRRRGAGPSVVGAREPQHLDAHPGRTAAEDEAGDEVARMERRRGARAAVAARPAGGIPRHVALAVGLPAVERDDPVGGAVDGEERRALLRRARVERLVAAGDRDDRGEPAGQRARQPVREPRAVREPDDRDAARVEAAGRERPVQEAGHRLHVGVTHLVVQLPDRAGAHGRIEDRDPLSVRRGAELQVVVGVAVGARHDREQQAGRAGRRARGHADVAAVEQAEPGRRTGGGQAQPDRVAGAFDAQGRPRAEPEQQRENHQREREAARHARQHRRPIAAPRAAGPAADRPVDADGAVCLRAPAPADPRRVRWTGADRDLERELDQAAGPAPAALARRALARRRLPAGDEARRRRAGGAPARGAREPRL